MSTLLPRFKKQGGGFGGWGGEVVEKTDAT